MNNILINHHIRSIYETTADYFETNSNYYWSKPKSLGGKTGFCIFYTKPSYNPDILIIGQNPSKFNPTDDTSEEDKYMMSGRIPEINSYLRHNHKFALKLREVFASQYDEYFPPRSVGMNLWFAQGKLFNTPDTNNLKKFCKIQTLKLIKILKPKTILCIGFEVFRELNNQNIHKNTLKCRKNIDRIYEEGKLADIPIFGCAHLTGAIYVHPDDRLIGVKQCILNIKKYLNEKENPKYA